MITVSLQELLEVELPGLASVEGEQDRTEIGLKVGAPVENPEDALHLRSALQLHDQAHSVAIRLVPDVGD